MEPDGTDQNQSKKKRQPARRAKLSKSVVEKIPVPADANAPRNYLWDTEVTGFGVMVTYTGKRSYLVQYTIGGRGGKSQRYNIGHHGNPWTLEQARSVARDKMMMVRQGIDPNQEKKARFEKEERRRKLAEDLNFEKLARVFLAAKSGLRTAKRDESIFNRILIPRFGRLPVTEIHRDDVHSMNDELGDSSESSANIAFARLKAFLNFASDKNNKLFPASPISRMKLPYAEGKRTRFLQAGEVRYLWLAVETLPGPVKACLQLLILTGLRRREVSRAQWREINLDSREWIIPAERMKNKKPHLVPLTDQMIAILKSLGPNPAQRRGYVMTLNGDTPIDSFSKTKELLDAALSRLIASEFRKQGHPLPVPVTLEDWVYHDLRRTLTSHLVREGVSVVHTEAVLSHSLPGVSQVSEHYVIYNFAAEKRHALELWGKLVEQYVNDSALFEVPTVPYEGEEDEDLEGLQAMEMKRTREARALRDLFEEVPHA